MRKSSSLTPGRWGGMILHEAMAKVVDSIVVDAHQIPGLMLHGGGGRRMNARAVGNNLHQRLDARILGHLVQLFLAETFQSG